MGSRLEKKSNEVRKRIENHEFKNEEGEEYESSKFGGFSDYFRRKKIKLQNLDVELRAASADNPPIFRGVVVHVNGYTQPSLNDIHTLVVSHGGGFIQYLDGKTQVTHIIASNLTPKKVEEFKRYRIVKPAWIVDSVNAGKLLPWNSYRVVDEGVSQKVLQFDNGKVVSQVNNRQRGYRDQTDTSWYTNQLVAAGDLSSTSKSSNTQLPTPDVTSSPPRDQDPNLGRAQDHQGESDGKATEEEIVVGDNSGQSLTNNAPPDNADDLADDNTPLDDHSVLNYDDQQAAEDENAPLDEDSVLDHDDQQAPEKSLIPDEEEHLPEEDAPTADLKRKSDSPSQASQAKKVKMTAEEHNAVLLSDPRIRKSSVLNPDFLDQYYRESRLHHLSAWKADLKAQLQAMTAELTDSQKARRKRPLGGRRYILHVDFDSFFVAVSLKNHPEFVDKPACVAHGSGDNSEIASCNYPARKFGVKNGMWMKRAHEFCKDLKVLPYDFPAYESASRLFYDAIMATGGIVQSISIDEALVDVTSFCLEAASSDGVHVREGNVYREQTKAEEIAQALRDEVKRLTGCAVSVGIGGNILLAKTALRKAKPAGQYHVKPEEAVGFLGELQVQDLPGVAYSIGGKLEEIGIKFVKDIRECSKEKLVNILGPKTGEKLWNYSRGIDRTEVGDQPIRKSVSAEVNWGVRFETQEQAEEFVESLCGELNKRLIKERVKGKHLTMKIMKRAADAPLDPPKHLGHGKCDTFNKSVVLGVATNAKEVIAKEALSILRFHGFAPGELRGLGVQMTKLEPLKGTMTGNDIGSQKRLQFTSRAPSGPVVNQTDTPLKTESNDAGPRHDQKHLQFKPESSGQAPKVEDPIQDDIVTPKKPKGSGLIMGAISNDSPSKKPLNTLGTQFLLPTQVDPSVLAELPEDVRSKLAKHVPQGTESDSKKPNKSKFPSTILPNQSELDPETLDALPEDVRSEILAHYATSPTNHSGQALLPQSPRKTRTLPAPRKTLSSRGRPRGSSSLLSRLKGGSARNSGVATLTQSNFVARIQTNDQASDSDTGTRTDGEIADDFLEALPEDIRREVLAQHRAEQRKRNAGIEVSGRRARRGVGGAAVADNSGEAQHELVISGDASAGGQKERLLVLPRKPEKPGFTTRKLSKIEDLRSAISLWHEEFREEGPYKEDVEALGRYLSNVVCDEGDMNKAVGVVKWMEWVVGDAQGEDSSKSERKWSKALESAKEFVKEAVHARGLGPVDL